MDIEGGKGVDGANIIMAPANMAPVVNSLAQAGVAGNNGTDGSYGGPINSAS
jgi:hypothetical protein